MRNRNNSHRSGFRTAIGLGSGATVLLCVALAVPAFGYTSRITRTVVVAQLRNGTATAVCPKGQHVSFGGVVGEFKPPPKTIGHAYVFPTTMRRSARDRWTVIGQSEAIGTGSHLSAVAYCDRGTAPSIVSRTVPLPSYGVNTAIATCPPGTVVVGGGYSSGSSLTHIEYVGQLAVETPRQWAVSMVNIVKAATTITATAYCAKGPAPTEHSAVLKLAGHRMGTARVICPAPTRLVFGGVVVSPPSGTAGHLSAVVPFSWSAPSTKQWTVKGYNLGGVTGTLVALAYCR